MKRQSISAAVVLGAIAALCLASGAVASTDRAGEGWRPDSWVTAKVKLALAVSENASAYDVNVDTTEGRVTLHGKVDSAEARSAASRIAESVDGVRAVDNLLQVVSPERRAHINNADDQLEESARMALAEKAALEDSDIEVESVNDGVVLLGGTASDLEDRLVAVRTVRAMPGVRRVESVIEGPDRVSSAPDVDEQAATAGEEIQDAAEDGVDAARRAGTSLAGAVSDAWVTAKVKSALIASEDVPALEINVDTTDGVVTLFGKVETSEAKSTAESEARAIDGVATVSNQLEVVPGEDAEKVAATDQAIRDRISQEISARDRFSNSDIDIEVSDGIVRLTGEASNADLRRSAAVIARSVGGVRAVRNEIDLQS